MSDGIGGFFGGEHLEHMPHILVHLEGAGNMGLVHFPVQLLGVGIQDLVGAHLDQRGREAGQIAQQGGQVGIAEVPPGGIGAAHGLDA